MVLVLCKLVPQCLSVRLSHLLCWSTWSGCLVFTCWVREPKSFYPSVFFKPHCFPLIPLINMSVYLFIDRTHLCSVHLYCTGKWCGFFVVEYSWKSLLLRLEKCSQILEWQDGKRTRLFLFSNYRCIVFAAIILQEIQVSFLLFCFPQTTTVFPLNYWRSHLV